MIEDTSANETDEDSWYAFSRRLSTGTTATTTHGTASSLHGFNTRRIIDQVCFAMDPNVIGVREAAEKKGCTRQAVYNAIDREDLNTVVLAGVTLILKDEKWRQYQVKEVGGRAHKSYQKSRRDNK